MEENPRLCGWGAEIVSIVVEEAFGALTGPPVRITTPHIPLPAADALEDHVLPSVARITQTVRESIGGRVTADLAALAGIDVPTGLFIDGEWTTNGRTLPVTNPATEDTLVEITDGTPDDALAAVAAAHGPCPAGPRRRPASARSACAKPGR